MKRQYFGYNRSNPARQARRLELRLEYSCRRRCRELTHQPVRKEVTLKREIIRVEPLSTYLEKWKAPTSAVTRHGDTIYVSGFPHSTLLPARSSTHRSNVRRSSFWNR